MRLKWLAIIILLFVVTTVSGCSTVRAIDNWVQEVLW